jgi:hypothetical protein
MLHCKSSPFTSSFVWLTQLHFLHTGCAVTPCSATSQASCRSPEDRRGAALPQEDVGGHVGVNHMQKVSRKGGNGDNSGQTPRGSGEPLRGFKRSPILRRRLGTSESLVL